MRDYTIQSTPLPMMRSYINSVAINDLDTWSCGFRSIAGLHVGCIIFGAQSSAGLMSVK